MLGSYVCQMMSPSKHDVIYITNEEKEYMNRMCVHVMIKFEPAFDHDAKLQNVSRLFVERAHRIYSFKRHRNWMCNFDDIINARGFFCPIEDQF